MSYHIIISYIILYYIILYYISASQLFFILWEVIRVLGLCRQRLTYTVIYYGMKPLSPAPEYVNIMLTIKLVAGFCFILRSLQKVLQLENKCTKKYWTNICVLILTVAHNTFLCNRTLLCTCCMWLWVLINTYIYLRLMHQLWCFI